MNSSNISTSLKKIPLPWKSSYTDNNQLVLSLDVNDYYKISIPTGFYCVNKKESSSQLKDTSSILFTWKKDPIPLELLYKFVRTSASVYNKYKSEFAACIFHNTKTNKYELLIPIQKISGASVTYNPSDGFKDYTDIKDMNMVVDMHSHHTMSIGFSSTDDHSDKEVGALGSISLVIKSINSFNFIDPDKSVDIRLNIQGKFYNLNLKCLFDIEDELFTFADNNFIEREEVKILKSTNIDKSLNIPFVESPTIKRDRYDYLNDTFERGFGIDEDSRKYWGEY